jgi:opacity protein-like surface antigen
MRTLPILAALAATAAILTTPASAPAQQITASGPEVEFNTVQGREGTTSIRVAGFEIRLGDDRRDTFNHRDKNREQWDYMPNSRPNWPYKNRESYNGRIGLFEFGVNFHRTYADSYAAYPDAEKDFMALNYNSTNLTFNFATFSTPLVRGGWLGATMAMGVTYNQWDLDTPTPLAKIDRRLRPVADGAAPRVSRLRYWGFHIPLVLEINPTRKFFLSGGGYADVMFWSDAKWKKPKQKLSDPYITPFQLGLTARVGFQDFYFWGKYSFSDFFQEGKGPRLNPYTIGFGLGF